MGRDASRVSASASFPRDKPMVVFWFVVFGALGLLGVAIPVGFALTERDEYGLLPVMVTLGGALSTLCASILALLVRALADPRDPITISAHGLRALAVSEGVISWRDIATVRVVHGRGRGILFDLKPEARTRVPLSPRARILAPIYRALGYPGFDIPVIDSTARLEQVVDALKAHIAVEGA